MDVKSIFFVLEMNIFVKFFLENYKIVNPMLEKTI